ncbi:tyrosine--tRNA ligase [Candidatus Kaiserbacteria bacterium CG10_big_fil_rev_8_21_14_0_10_51_14]|uniref:Tyrosine--tRNA ligase n=1 Tax=Candidatus Kaiserbacteria bacterium CG10_big_fil_rev_8_21_14_0_10_51_14 TaxID=1974610 RepID=A0A2H0UB37_9BACT|nr:MAG: tyrosine--tRNA ligase [Candidatus Kaiserbacteria bacterium CG10_big_fil_rev_8_21_14_0_10_51_14]
MAKLSEVLQGRGLVHQFSSEKLEEITDGKKRTIYIGVDPTADSIHVGNLAAYMLLRRFAEDGHKVILVVGGGTGMIGDPKPDVERPLLDKEIIAARVEKLKTQVQKLFEGKEIEVVNNADWLEKLTLIEFLRDIGKYFTVNNLVKKDAISARMKSEEGISFTEFSYPLLQAYDFWHLFTEHGCDVQIGGSDQWGNIISGVELIRRKEKRDAYALTIPIIADKATGKKFGKSEGNAIWLDPAMTSPYAFFQFWLGTSDESVVDYLKIFTLLADMEISAAMELHRRDAKERHAQKILAREMTTLVHGADEAMKAELVTSVLFGEESISSLDESAVATLREAAPLYEVEADTFLIDALVGAKLASSKTEARRFFKDKAVFLNDKVVKDAERTLVAKDFHNGIALLRRGKKNVCMLALK